MYIEALTVCVGYGDFLQAVAPHNVGIFDRWVIVTEPSDLLTREVCRRFSLECILSDEGRRKGADFNKGWLIERGLQHLSAEGHRLHIDADMALPVMTRRLLEAANLDAQTIYGCDRVMVKNWADWARLLDSGYLVNQHDYHHRVRFPAGFDVGTRWVNPAVGYVPIGAFQLWHSDADQWHGVRIRPYPSRHNDACRADVQHGLYFDRRQRALVPEIIAAHLESEPCKLGANWRGRTTRWFGPEGSEPANWTTKRQSAGVAGQSGPS